MYVSVRDNNVDQALRVLKKKMQREGMFREMKNRRAYEKPSERRAREMAESTRRVRKIMRKRLEREDSSTFYTCSSKCLRIKFDNALENDFRCSECNKVLKEMSNAKVIKEIKKELSMLEETSSEEHSTIAEVTA